MVVHSGLLFHLYSLLWLVCLLSSTRFHIFAATNFVNNCGNHRRVFGPSHDSTTFGRIDNYQNGTFNCEWLIATGRKQSTQHNFINLRLISNGMMNCSDDVLYVFDGPSYEDTLIATLKLNGRITNLPVLTASSGYMLLLQYSPESSIPSAFTAEFSITECPLNCSDHGVCDQSTNHCLCDQFRKGEACQIDICPGNCSISGQCILSSLSSNETTCSDEIDHVCQCMSDYIGQSCDVVKSEIATQKHWRSNWKILFTGEKLFRGRASHSSTYDPVTDIIYTYGGRSTLEATLGDLLAYSVTSNRWQNLSSCQLNDSPVPKPLYGHTLNAFNSSLFLFGGIYANGTLTNQLWIYDMASKEWSVKRATHNIPCLAFHTATLVDSELYIVGGRFQNGSHSSGLYRISLLEEHPKWHSVQPLNDKPFGRQLTGHSTVYYKPLRSIVIFGGALLMGERNARLSNDMHLFNVDNRVWSRLQFSRPQDASIPAPRAFHSMLLVEHYLIVFGGHTEDCSDTRLYVYSLICHKWNDFDYFLSTLSRSLPSSHFSIEGLVSHSVVLRRNLIFVLGGFSGHVRNEIFVYTLPKVLFNASQYELCSRLKSKLTCNLEPYCFWCPVSGTNRNRSMATGYCAHNELKCSAQAQLDFCPGLCARLSSCYSCLAFNTIESTAAEMYDEDEMGGYAVLHQSHSCLWNSLDLRCFHNNISESVHFNHFLASYSDCKMHNIESGITFLKYHYPQNLSHPDQVAILRRIDVQTSFRDGLAKNLLLNDNEMDYSALKRPDLVNIGRILGYVHPFGLQPYHQNQLRLYLGSTSLTNSTFLFNGHSMPLKNVSHSSKSLHRSYVDLPVNFSSDTLLEDNFLVDLIVRFPIRTIFQELEYEQIELTFAENANPAEILSNSNLTPYHDKQQCNQSSSCSACLSNQACTWCPTSGQCITRSNLSQCLSDQMGNISVVVDAEQCTTCEDYLDCEQCVTSGWCEWLVRESRCLRRGRFTKAIRHKSSCSRPCSGRNSCEMCLDDTGHCVWCQSRRQCASAASYQSSPALEFCQRFDAQMFTHNAFFLNKPFLVNLRLNYSQILCDKCLRHSSCLLCENIPFCGWCFHKSDSSQGFCAMKSSINHNECNLSAKLLDTSQKNIVNVSSQWIDWRQFVSVSNGTCPLVDECQLGLHNCHPDALCINTEQSFLCSCRPGFTGDGLSCTRTCDRDCFNGYCSEFPDYKCICDLGWTGPSCNVDCGCNKHSTCHSGPGKCDHCEDNTAGDHCHLCSVGSFGNATNSTGCRPCECNGHADAGLCDYITGICHCLDNTEGVNCERCRTGFYGDARRGGHCFMECQHRAMISQMDHGFFGSYIRNIHFNRLHSLQDHLVDAHISCLWIFTTHKSPKQFDTFSSYHSSLVHDANTPTPIRVTIFGSSQLNCSSSRVSVYDGIPRFVSASIEIQATTLANLCGYDARADTRIVATSGFVTVYYSSENLSHGFNASIAKLPLPSTVSNPTHQLPPNSQDNTTRIFPSDKSSFYLKRKTLQSNLDDGLNPSWPKWDHSLHIWNDLLLFEGGHEDVVHLSLTIFNLSSNSWQQQDQPSKGHRPSNRHLHASTVLNGTIFVHGGLSSITNEVFRDSWSCSLLHFNSSLHFKWSRIDAIGQENIPPLLGHTLTGLWYANEPALLLVGGYSPTDGFLRQQFIYLRESNQWQSLLTKGASPIGIFGHSTVYYPESNSVYLFGGVHFEDTHKTAVSNSLYVLNLASAVWHRVRSSDAPGSPWPEPRFLHLVASTDHFMLMTGGHTSNENVAADHSIWIFRFDCNTWMTLNENQFNDRASLVAHRKTHVQSLALDRSGNRLYFYETASCSANATINGRISVIQMPSDLCLLHSTDRKACLAVSGCSFCASPSGNHSTGHCFDSAIPQLCSSVAKRTRSQFVAFGAKCNAQKQSRPCTMYGNCVDCTTRNYELNSGEESCQWCTNCRDKQGRCISLNDTCDWLFATNSTANDDICDYSSVENVSMCPLQRCLATDCDKCLQIAQAHPGKPRCIWTRQVYNFVKLGHNSEIFDWTCIDSTIIEEALLPNVETVPPLACPARCHKLNTCSLCLEAATGDESGSHECVWSEMTQECMSPTYALLRCSSGRCGGLLHRKSSAQCPADCESHTKASDCLSASHCGWCAISGFELDGVGLCLRGGLFGSVNEPCTGGNANLLALLMRRPFYKPISSFNAQWHYLYLPKENECANGHHTCNAVSQECIDLEDGFMCRCKTGYILAENTCKPICHRGCVHGVCKMPNLCECSFGYIGSDCSLQCQCNGHGSCQSESLDQCSECHNNTMGQFCEKCKPFFVGEPRNEGTCTSCEQYCHTHSSNCFNQNWLNGSLATANVTDQNFWDQLASQVTEGIQTGAVCINCQNNTEGERCDRCRLGFFKISDDIRDGCRRCACGQHGWLCNPFNGENCNCQNNTENDRQCNYLNTKEYANYINKTYFFKSAQIMTTYSLPCWMLQCSKCKDYFYGVPTNGHQCYRHMNFEKEYCLDPDQEDCLRNPRPLSTGRTVFFGIQPRYMNVDIKIVLNVIQGNVDVYLASSHDLFVVQTNGSNGFHRIFLDKNYVQPQFTNISNTDEEYIRWLSVDDGTMMNYEHTLRRPFYLREHHLGGAMPQYYTVESDHEIAIFRNVRQYLFITISYKTQDLRNTRYFLVIRGNHMLGNDAQSIQSLGYILFRQDQCRIDLFVFFSVFFSSFFLFLCFSVLAWKMKQFLDNRRVQHLHEIELQHMASRPFSSIILQIDPSIGFRKAYGQSVSVQSTPAKKMSLFRQLTLGFRETPKIYPESVHSTTKLSEKTKSESGIRPVAVEPTADGMAAILTTFVLMPGDLVPNRLAAGTTLVSLRHSPQLVQQFNSAK